MQPVPGGGQPFLNALAPPPLPLGKAPGGECGRRSHVLDGCSAQSLLCHDGLVVFADERVEHVGVGEKSLANGFYGRRELRHVPNALERDPELIDRLRVELLAAPIQEPGETSEFLRGDRLERHFGDTVGESRRNAEAGEHEAVLGATERFEQSSAAMRQLFLEPLHEHRLRTAVPLTAQGLFQQSRPGRPPLLLPSGQYRSTDQGSQ